MEDQSEIIIISAKSSPRLLFVADFLQSITGVRFTVTLMNRSKDDFNRPGNCVINYSERPIEGAFNIFSSGLMLEAGVRPLDPDVVKLPEQTLLFPAPEGFDLPFDLFSAVFFMLSRYEENLPYTPDRYGRFEADQSLAFRHGFLEQPVVDQWLEMLKKALHSRFADLNFTARESRFISTIDVDNPWAYLHKGWLRTISGLTKCLLQFRFHEFHNYLYVLLGFQTDPFDTYEYIKKVEAACGFRSLFFFLSGNYGRYDVNHALHTTPFRNLLKHLKTGRSIGIHPSFRSNRSFHILESEFNQFTKLTGEKPVMSRQHFLILKLPNTYQNLIRLGIEQDYSMGFASSPGFRAGTSRSFRFYDLQEERATSLIVNSFVVMDVTLQQYLGLTPEEAALKINRLMEEVSAVKGDFTSLWHNESLSDQGVWKGWRAVFEGMGKRTARIINFTIQFQSFDQASET